MLQSTDPERLNNNEDLKSEFPWEEELEYRSQGTGKMGTGTGGMTWKKDGGRYSWKRKLDGGQWQGWGISATS